MSEITKTEERAENLTNQIRMEITRIAEMNERLLMQKQ